MSNLNGSMSLDSVANFLDSMTGDCKAPFVAYREQFCVPSCPSDDIAADPRYVTALKVFSYISMTTQYICSFLIFYTWTRVKELRSFSHMVAILMVLFYFLSVVIFSLPLIGGRKNFVCSADDTITHNEKGPTKFCIIQGAMLHFSLLSASVWFCCSVFNITVAVLSFSADNVIKRHPRAVFVIQCFLAVSVPGGLVGYALGTSSYQFWPLTYTCIASSVSVFFFTGVLPGQIVCVCTTTMVILIIRRIRQSNALRNSLISTNQKASIAQTALTKRFMIIAMMFPFTHVFLFTLALVYNIPSVKRQLTIDIQDYTLCLMDAGNSGGRSCSSTALMDSFAFTRIVDMIIYGLFGVIILIYYFMPTPARQFWMSRLKRLSKIVSSLKRKESGDVQSAA